MDRRDRAPRPRAATGAACTSFLRIGLHLLRVLFTNHLRLRVSDLSTPFPSLPFTPPLQARAVVSRKAARVAHVVRAAEGDEKAAAAPDAFAGIKPTKANDFKAMSNDDLLKEMTTAKKMLFELRMRQSTRKEYKGHHFGILKTKIAQIRTVKRDREVAEGVTKRDSRKIKREERNANLYL